MEANNVKAMREAMNNIGNAAAWVAENCNDQQTAKYMNDIIAMVQAALAAPPRNCDVGTAEEQMRRFVNFCRCNCDACPIGKTDKSCPEAWSQMPYESETAE